MPTFFRSSRSYHALMICLTTALMVAADPSIAREEKTVGSMSAAKTETKSLKREVVASRKSSEAKPSKLTAKGGTRVVHASSRKVVVATRRGKGGHVVAVREISLERPSLAQTMGLRGSQDALDLNSSVALVVDQNTNEVLFEKNPHAVLPIASITKLMTALVVAEANLPLDEILTVTDEDRDLLKGSSSRLAVGTQLTREEMLRLALMSSENRAASALGRHYPGGIAAFVHAMNAKARRLGMGDSFFVDPTGLSSRNVSSAGDLTKLVTAASRIPMIREFSTTPSHEANISGRLQHFVNTNRLVRAGDWEIGLQKTGYISEAGRCLVMQAKVHGRQVVMVFLDSVGKLSRFGDAVRVRNWLESNSDTTNKLFGNGSHQVPIGHS